MTTDTPPATLPILSATDILARLDELGPQMTTVDVPELGSGFKVRGLSRAEVLRINRMTTSKDGTQDQLRADWLTIETALVEPKLTQPEYHQLRMHPRATAALNRIQTAIARLTTGQTTNDDGQEVDAVTAAEQFPGGAS